MGDFFRDVLYRNLTVLSPDPHRFDGDHDGVGGVKVEPRSRPQLEARARGRETRQGMGVARHRLLAIKVPAGSTRRPGRRQLPCCPRRPTWLVGDPGRGSCSRFSAQSATAP